MTVSEEEISPMLLFAELALSLGTVESSANALKSNFFVTNNVCGQKKDINEIYFDKTPYQ